MWHWRANIVLYFILCLKRRTYINQCTVEICEKEIKIIIIIIYDGNNENKVKPNFHQKHTLVLKYVNENPFYTQYKTTIYMLTIPVTLVINKNPLLVKTHTGVILKNRFADLKHQTLHK